MFSDILNLLKMMDASSTGFQQRFKRYQPRNSVNTSRSDQIRSDQIIYITKDHYNYQSNLCDTFSLNNLIKGKTCFKADSGTYVDVMLTSRPRSFHKTSIVETGFSDHHNMILSFFRTHFERLKFEKSQNIKIIKSSTKANSCFDLIKNC